MVRHIILWKLKEEVKSAEDVKSAAKRELEALLPVIDGAIKIELKTEALASSNCDMMLDSSFDSVESYEKYRVHPAHVKVADTFIRPFADVRLCFDFEE